MTEKPAGRSASGGARARRVATAERDHRISLPAARTLIEKTRQLVYERGIASATVGEIARASDVTSTSTPLWYFGSKGRLLIEVLRLDHDERLTLVRERLGAAQTREELVGLVHGMLREFLDERTRQGSHELMAEITRIAVDDEEVAAHRGELRREYRDVLARVLGDKQRDGVVLLAGHATSVAALLICLAQGFAVEIAADRGWKADEALEDARTVIEALLREPLPE